MASADRGTPPSPDRGVSTRPPGPDPALSTGAQAATPHPGQPELVAYVRGELRGQAVYGGYRPRAAVLRRVAERLPGAHVVVVSGAWCPDCRREVPKLARILELLPAGWSVELRGDEEASMSRLGVRAIPTFVVFDRPEGRELGRIVESADGPQGLEGELLAIAERAAAPEQAA